MTPHRIPRVLLAALLATAFAFVLAACGETQDDSSGGGQQAETSSESAANPNAEIKKGLKTVSMPKQLGNPYEETEHSDEHAEE